MGIKLSIFAILILFINPFINPASAYQLDLPFTQIDGSISNLSIYEGNYLLVDAFATWCEACRLAMVHLLNLYDVVKGKLSMLSLSVDPKSDTIKDVKEFRDDFNAPWDFGLDHSEQFMNRYPIEIYPTVFLFDENGTHIKTWIDNTKTSEFLSDLSEYIDVPSTYEDTDDFSNYLNNLISNPIFLIVSSFIGINVLYLIIRSIIKVFSSQNKTN